MNIINFCSKRMWKRVVELKVFIINYSFFGWDFIILVRDEDIINIEYMIIFVVVVLKVV